MEVIKLQSQDKTNKAAVRHFHRRRPKVTEVGHDEKFANVCRNKFLLPHGRIGNARKGLEIPIK